MPIPRIPLPIGPFYSFFPRGEAAFASSGDIDVWWHQPTAKQVFRIDERRRSAFHFFGEDQATNVWRSDPLVAGSPEEMFGVPIGPPDSTLIVGSGDIRRRPQTMIDQALGHGHRRKFFAELHSLRMRATNVEVLAGEPFLAHLRNDLGLAPAEVARVFRRSFGEVVSWDLTGDPERDFPADNHFNVFFAVKFDATPDAPALTLFNREPLVVVDLGLTGLPPFDRVTIPQFPYDTPTLYHVTPPTSVEAVDGGFAIAGSGGCCAHSVRGQRLDTSVDLPFRPINFDELGADLGGKIEDGAGITLDSATLAARGAKEGPRGKNRAMFRKAKGRFIDGVFVPNGPTQVTSTGLTFVFDDTHGGAASEAIRNGISVLDDRDVEMPIHVDAPTNALAYQPPQLIGIGLGPNAGITFDLAALRDANPDFYLVSMVALEGMSAESTPGSRVRLHVLVDGVVVPFATREFSAPGANTPISVDLQLAQRYLTIASTSPDHGANGVFALFQLRGFGWLSGEQLPPYAGPARP